MKKCVLTRTETYKLEFPFNGCHCSLADWGSRIIPTVRLVHAWKTRPEFVAEQVQRPVSSLGFTAIRFYGQQMEFNAREVRVCGGGVDLRVQYQVLESGPLHRLVAPRHPD